MNLNRAMLKDAVDNGLLSSDQAEKLWEFVLQRGRDTPSFRFTHVLYYFGGLIAIGAMTLFMNVGWEAFGGWGLFVIALVYGVAGLWFTEYLLGRLRLPIPAGIVATFVVVLAPLAVYGLTAAFGWWEEGRPYQDYFTDIDWRWGLMELASLVVGLVLLWRYRLPLLTLPIVVTLWYISIDIVPALLGQGDTPWKVREQVSLWFGVLVTLGAFWIDMRSRPDKDYAFWFYLVGVAAFWLGLSLMHWDDELANAVYFVINLLLIILGSIVSRRVFVVFGVLGAVGYISYLAYDVFRDSMVFPFALTVIGFAVIYLGIVWQRREQAIAGYLRGLLPHAMQKFLDRRGDARKS